MSYRILRVHTERKSKSGLYRFRKLFISCCICAINIYLHTWHRQSMNFAFDLACFKVYTILILIIKSAYYYYAPLTAAATANPKPVLPEVGSTIVQPGFSLPLISASSTILKPMRSFTEPPGLKNSTLATTNRDNY